MHQVWFGVGLTAMAAVTVGIARWARAGLGWQPLLALLRATIQLMVIAVVLRGVLTVPWTVVAFVGLMLATASWTAGGRIAALPSGRRHAALGVVAGAATAVAPALALRLVPVDARHLIALGGIVIGAAMNAATLAGRRFRQMAALRRDEVEGWLALGATPSRAYDDIARQAVHETLLPNLDQTRSSGLVTLPGAFVGALFGGASPLAAAEFQLVVLASVVLAMLVCGLTVALLSSRSPFVVAD